MSERARQGITWMITVARDTALWCLGAWMIYYEVRHGQPGHLRLEVLLLGGTLVTSPVGFAAWAARHGIGTSGSPSSQPLPRSAPPSEQSPSIPGAP